MTSLLELKIMYTGLEELVGQVPLEFLTPSLVIMMQNMHQTLSNSWKGRTNKFHQSFVIWPLVVVGGWAGFDAGVLDLQEVMGVGLIHVMVEGVVLTMEEEVVLIMEGVVMEVVALIMIHVTGVDIAFMTVFSLVRRTREDGATMPGRGAAVPPLDLINPASINP